MKVSSLVRVDHVLIPTEVELMLASGLPQISIIGLPDAALKESTLRIRSAIRAQGFELPQSQQVIVSVTPTFVRKTSRGLDLAIAAALLWETGQLAMPTETPILYGELTLTGDVVQPDDLIEAPDTRAMIITGRSDKTLPFSTTQITNLASLIEGGDVVTASEETSFTRPQTRVREFSSVAAEFARVVAAGEHSFLMIGPAGSGKSTLADAIPAWIEEPTPETLRETRLSNMSWRPVLKPHHSITPLAMIGGGVSIWPGEITRAHGGVLVMDELLQFHPDIQESLREPVESGCITITRGGASRTFPARVLLIATSNLCRCGNFVPRKSDVHCRCKKADRQRILTRLTGPFVDRFALIAMADDWDSGGGVGSDSIAADVARAIAFRRARGQSVPNSRLASEVIEDSLDDFDRKHLVGCARSRRRKAALLRVARTLADLRLSEKIAREDLETARRLTVQTHRMLEEWTD